MVGVHLHKCAYVMKPFSDVYVFVSNAITCVYHTVLACCKLTILGCVCMKRSDQHSSTGPLLLCGWHSDSYRVAQVSLPAVLIAAQCVALPLKW